MVITQQIVNESLDSAVVNGYDLQTWPAARIANDLSSYDQQFEGIEPVDLIPLIERWKELRYGKSH